MREKKELKTAKYLKHLKHNRTIKLQFKSNSFSVINFRQMPVFGLNDNAILLLFYKRNVTNTLRGNEGTNSFSYQNKTRKMKRKR